jgi:hypothetical protein
MSAADSAMVDCPYCGEAIELLLDCPEGRHAYVEDCQVCCRPIDVYLHVGPGGQLELRVSDENEV